MSVKYRETAGPLFQGHYAGGIVSSQRMNSSSESIEGFNHNLNLLGKADCGGPMLLRRTQWSYTPNVVTGDSQGIQGSQLPLSGFGSPLINHPEVDADNVMNARGATAIARTIPLEPVFNSVTALREAMADGFPSVPGLNSWRDRTLRAKQAGGEYLNVEFGWLPLVSDMRNFATAVKDHHTILRDLRSGSNKTTRVGYHFPSSNEFLSYNGSVYIYFPGNSGYSTTTASTKIESQRVENWFTGAFSYHLPVSDSMLGKAQLYAEYADKLLGVKPTPEAIWNSSPWTWALDWFSNAGDVVTNISQLGQNGLVLLYGYVMSHCVTETRITAAARPDAFGGFSAGGVTLKQEWKKRLGADHMDLAFLIWH